MVEYRPEVARDRRPRSTGRGFALGGPSAYARHVRTGILAVAALLALAPASAAAADRPSHDGPRAAAAIVGGHAANIANWPSIAFVVAFSGQDAAACTGTVIAPRWVVSAAHCAFDGGNQPVDALVTLTAWPT
jgi:secreted trypsin-like serine protease